MRYYQQQVDWDALKVANEKMFPVKPEPEPEPEPIKVFEIDDDYNESLLWELPPDSNYVQKCQDYVDENDAYLQVVVSETEVRYFYSESETQAGCTRCGSMTCAGVGSTGIVCNGKQS